jgi:hypothetical protein
MKIKLPFGFLPVPGLTACLIAASAVPSARGDTPQALEVIRKKT